MHALKYCFGVIDVRSCGVIPQNSLCGQGFITKIPVSPNISKHQRGITNGQPLVDYLHERRCLYRVDINCIFGTGCCIYVLPSVVVLYLNSVCFVLRVKGNTQKSLSNAFFLNGGLASTAKPEFKEDVLDIKRPQFKTVRSIREESYNS